MNQSLVDLVQRQPDHARRGARARDRARRAQDHARAAAARRRQRGRRARRLRRSVRCRSIKWQGVSPQRRDAARARWRRRAARRSIIRLRSAAHPAGRRARSRRRARGSTARSRCPSFGAPVKPKRHRHLHAPVRDDDRRRPAARAVPRHPRRADRQQGASARSSARSRTTSRAARRSPTRSRKHPKVFDDLYTNLVAAGEIGGILDTILNRLAIYLEKAAKLKRKIKGAMIYPACIVAAAVIVTGDPAHLGHPGLRRDVLRASAQALPAPTQFVINLSNFTIAYFCVPGGAPGHRRRRARATPTAPSAAAYAIDQLHAAAPDLRRAHPQDRRRALHAHARHAGLVRRADPRRARHQRRAPPATRSSRRRSCNARSSISEGKHDRRAADREQGVPAHGLPDDRASARRPARWTRCCRRSPTSTRTRSTPRSRT